MKTKGRKQSTGSLMIQVPFTAEEREAFDKFVSDRGLKKGAYVRKAVFESMARDREEEIAKQRRTSFEVTR